ncbi:MAG: WxcM-like domain-containing protein [Fibrobacterales bacterium]|nr:WxcM-like domain-containing protein [Fibrobacterales bacterium]
MGLEQVKTLDLPVVSDVRGNLAVAEGVTLPFAIARAYWLYDVPAGSTRGGHAHRRLQQVLIALSGSFDVVLDDGRVRKTVSLNRPDRGLYLPRGIWRELENFSAGAVCLVLASEPYDESEYVRDYGEFLALSGK